MTFYVNKVSLDTKLIFIHRSTQSMKQAQKSTKQTSTKEKVSKSLPVAHAVGRRKKAVARVWLRKGSGKITVNGLDYANYFDTEVARLEASKPFLIIPISEHYNVEASVIGGGKKGQAGAVKLGIARALLHIDENIKPALREHDLITVDSRQKERKKYGQRGARRKFQFVKR